jgi:catechol 2,3-dioxygenase-like lactoylglutathione lyase family enzyme
MSGWPHRDHGCNLDRAMRLLDHISITVRNIERAKLFYTAVLGELGAVVAYDEPDAIGFGERNEPHDDSHTYLSIFQSAAAAPDPRRHCCFRAHSEAQVRAFHSVGLQAGGTDAGGPGLRAYHPQYFAAFLLDPEGNKIEAVFHGGARENLREAELGKI